MTQQEINIYMGKVIRGLRQAKGMSQEGLASFLDMARTSIMNIEAGRHSTTTDNIMKLCALFNVTPNDLLPVENLRPIQIVEETVEVMVPKKITKVRIIKNHP